MRRQNSTYRHLAGPDAILLARRFFMADFIKRVGTNGKVSWQARVRRKGFPDMFKTFRTKVEAQKWAAVTESEMARHVFTDRSLAERTTLGDALEVYRDEVTVEKAGHQEGYVIKAWLKHPLAKRTLSSLKVRDFQAWVTEKKATVGPKTIKLHIGVISNLYNRLENLLEIEALPNPILKLILPPLPEGRDRRLNVIEHDDGTVRNEAEALIGACADAVNPWVRPAVEFALDGAMRRNEIVQMRWEHVDLNAGMVRLPAAITKTGVSRDVALSPAGVQVLRTLPRSIDGRVFPLTADALYRVFVRARKRAGLDDLHFHDLRHEAASRLREEGLDLMEIASITGHKTLQMLKRYVHVKAKDVVEKRQKSHGGSHG
jgi:integrase